MPCSKIPSALTRKDLSEAIYKALSTISRRDAGRIVDDTFVKMIEALVRNEPVRVFSSLAPGVVLWWRGA
jgi:nucleoid DNA-binding protein